MPIDYGQWQGVLPEWLQGIGRSAGVLPYGPGAAELYDPEAIQRFALPESGNLKQLRSLAMAKMGAAPGFNAAAQKTYAGGQASGQAAMGAANAVRGGAPAVGMTGGANDVAALGARGGMADAQQSLRNTAMGGGVAGETMDRNLRLQALRNSLSMGALNRRRASNDALADSFMGKVKLAGSLFGGPAGAVAGSLMGGQGGSKVGGNGWDSSEDYAGWGG